MIALLLLSQQLIIYSSQQSYSINTAFTYHYNDNFKHIINEITSTDCPMVIQIAPHVHTTNIFTCNLKLLVSDTMHCCSFWLCHEGGFITSMGINISQQKKMPSK